ncbi:hypothetical protein [Halobium salinum]|uniref:hypothetical protein n=1 Tax=Halobium salinum TaxID=1364940 RepID=UPI002271E5FF|nr:hypothetical protein [Halobium salinum]
MEDFEAWKAVFDDHMGMRKRFTEQSHRLFRSVGDPNELTLLFEFDDADRAREFVESEDLRLKMKEAGVEGRPEFSFLDHEETLETRRSPEAV